MKDAVGHYPSPSLIFHLPVPLSLSPSRSLSVLQYVYEGMKISDLLVDLSVAWNGNFIIDNPERVKGRVHKNALFSSQLLEMSIVGLPYRFYAKFVHKGIAVVTHEILKKKLQRIANVLHFAQVEILTCR